MTYCNTCDVKNESDSVFCFSCGSRIQLNAMDTPQSTNLAEKLSLSVARENTAINEPVKGNVPPSNLKLAIILNWVTFAFYIYALLFIFVFSAYPLELMSGGIAVGFGVIFAIAAYGLSKQNQIARILLVILHILFIIPLILLMIANSFIAALFLVGIAISLFMIYTLTFDKKVAREFSKDSLSPE